MKSHGGPTSAASATFNLGVQFWTSRGIAVLDVNYGGSTGYGRAYRQPPRRAVGRRRRGRLHAAAPWPSPPRERSTPAPASSPGAAPGATPPSAPSPSATPSAPAAATTASATWRRLATDTHKFESRYLDRLVGPYPARRDLYLERSPIHHVDRLACPVIFFQGLEDAIVPPSQAETMVAALRARGLPVAYLAFPGEQHGFRRAEHIARALDAELYFYARICDFPLAGDVEPLPDREPARRPPPDAVPPGRSAAAPPRSRYSTPSESPVR